MSSWIPDKRNAPTTARYNDGLLVQSSVQAEQLIVDITLSLPYDLTAEQWKIVDDVFRNMHGWIGYDSNHIPQWFGPDPSPRYVWASVEPSGLLISANLPERYLLGWISVLCARLSLRLGFEVRDAEM